MHQSVIVLPSYPAFRKPAVPFEGIGDFSPVSDAFSVSVLPERSVKLNLSSRPNSAEENWRGVRRTLADSRNNYHNYNATFQICAKGSESRSSIPAVSTEDAI